MEQLEKKTVNGRPYYYYSKWGWRNGKCRRLWQKYLGKLEDIVKAVDGDLIPQYAEIFQFGLPSAVWHECKKQNVGKIIDSICPKRDQGLSVGRYMAIAAVNRAIKPSSKKGMWEWFSQTSLLRAVPEATAAALDSNRFWDHMDAISPENAQASWKRIIRGTINREQLDLSTISYDGTNFYTFIDTFNVKSKMARRGKNKQGRNNLRQVSYSLFCSRDGGIPLFYDIYEGNLNDAKEFPLVTKRFHNFLNNLSTTQLPTPKITLVFDKGNNSADNFALLDQCEIHFITTVKLSEHKDLAEISNNDKRFVCCTRAGLESVKVLSLNRTLYGKERKVLVMFNQELFNTQLKTVNADIDKALEALSDLKQRLDDRANGLIKGGRAPTKGSVEKKCKEIRKRQYLKDLIWVNISEGAQITYGFDSSKLDEITDTYLGKKIVITTRKSWEEEEIIEALNSQYIIEHVFRDMKHRDIGSWWPLNHWTDQKIHVHAMYCTIAMLLRALIHRRVRQSGLMISMQRMLKELDGIKEVVNVYIRSRRRPAKRQTVLTKQNAVQQQLCDILNLPLLR